jgi:hypothetical protein
MADVPSRGSYETLKGIMANKHRQTLYCIMKILQSAMRGIVFLHIDKLKLRKFVDLLWIDSVTQTGVAEFRIRGPALIPRRFNLVWKLGQVSMNRDDVSTEEKRSRKTKDQCKGGTDLYISQ